MSKNPGITVSEVITSTEAKVEQQLQVLAFMMKHIKKHYQYQLRYLNAPDDLIQNVHMTGLKTNILRRVPRLCKQKKC